MVLQWENLKKLMIKTAKDYSGSKARQKNLLIEKVENKIMLLDRKITESTPPDDIDEWLRSIKKTEEFLMNEHEQKVEALKTPKEF